MSDVKRVWVLGAGFSRALGGPLLRDLLSAASYEHLAICYPDSKTLGDSAAHWVLRVYAWGTAYRYGCPHETEGPGSGQDLWPDAEVFLDQLDAASGNEDGPTAQRIRRIIGELNESDAAYQFSEDRLPSIKQLAAAARRLVAAECCSFLKDAPVETSERWQPYREWAQQLGANDTIVTFNYDLVIESLRANHIMPVLREEQIGEAEITKCGQLLKLHGSVDWRKERLSNGQWVIRRMKQTPHFALDCTDDEICLATPGPTKASTSKQLQLVWSRAHVAIEEADAIYFIGYRFPPTDAEARKWLLGAIRANRKDMLALHTVLGPNLGHEDSVRLQALLKNTCERAKRRPPQFGSGNWYEVRTHPLYAEDFLSVWHPGI